MNNKYPYNILVVEDEFSINDTLKFALSKENFEVKGAYNGETALKIFNEFVITCLTFRFQMSQ